MSALNDIGLDRSEGMERLSEYQTAMVFNALSTEVKATLVDMFEPDEKLDAAGINTRVLKLQNGNPLYTPSDATYPEAVDLLATRAYGVFDMTPGHGSAFTRTPNLYALSDVGVAIYRPAAEQLLGWGVSHNARFGKFFGGAKLPSAESTETPGIILSLRALFLARELMRFTNKDLTKEINAIDGGRRKRIEHPLNRLVSGKLVMESRVRGKRERIFTFNPQASDAVDALGEIVTRTVRLDPSFYAEGHANANKRLERLKQPDVEQPDDIRYLLQRTGHCNESLGDRQLHYPELVDRSFVILTKSDVPMTVKQLLRAMGIDASDSNRRSRFAAILAAHPGIRVNIPDKGAKSYAVIDD